MLCSGHCPRGSLQRSHQRPEASEGREGFSLKMDEARGCRHCPPHRTPPHSRGPLGEPEAPALSEGPLGNRAQRGDSSPDASLLRRQGRARPSCGIGILLCL